MVRPGSVGTVVMPETAVSTRTPGEPIGKGGAGAARPSNPPVLVVSEERFDAEKAMRDPFHQRCESSDVTLTGCVRARLSGLA